MEEIDFDGAVRTPFQMYQVLKAKQYSTNGVRGRDFSKGISVFIQHLTAAKLYGLILALLSIEMDAQVECTVCPELRPSALWINIKDTFRSDVANIHTIINTGPDYTTVQQLMDLCKLYDERVVSYLQKNKATRPSIRLRDDVDAEATARK